MGPAPASASASSANYDYFQHQKERHQKALEERAQEKQKAVDAQAVVAPEWQETVQLMFTAENDAFLELGAADPAVPREFLRTSAGVNHFFQRFFLETTLISDKYNTKLIEPTEAWKAALQERGRYEAPLDISLKDMWLTTERIEKLVKLLPNIRSFKVDGYVYQGEANALNILALLQARLPRLEAVEMKNGYLLPKLELIKKRVEGVAKGLFLYNVLKEVADPNVLQAYFPKLTPNERVEELCKIKSFTLDLPRKFCRGESVNIVINDLIKAKSPLLKKAEPLVMELPKEKEVAPIPVAASEEWEETTEAGWCDAPAAAAADDWA